MRFLAVGKPYSTSFRGRALPGMALISSNFWKKASSPEGRIFSDSETGALVAIDRVRFEGMVMP